MELNDICNEYDVEDGFYECKSRLNRDNVFDWLKTVDGFANAKGGGVFFIGVEDKTNKLIGFEQSELDNEKQFFYKTVQEHIQTIPPIETKPIPYTIRDKKRYILKIFVGESQMKPVILKFQGMPMVFIRKDGYTSPATTEEMLSLSLTGTRPQFDLCTTDQIFDEKNFQDLYAFYKKNTGKDLKEKELASIGFFDKNRKLAKGATLFQDDYDGKDTQIVCSMYKGLTRGDDDIIASNNYQGNLIKEYYYMSSFIEQRMNHGFHKKATSREDIDSFPARSLFEAIINSLTHRDYFITGSAIYVDLFKNRLVISSPGGLFGSPSENIETYKLDSFISRRRNTLISNVFVLCKAMEAKGTGFEKITQDYKDAKLSHKPYLFVKNNQFSIVLPDLTYADGIQTDEDSYILLQKVEKPSKYDLSVLAFCFSSYKSVKEITEHLGVSNSTFFRKNVISNLLDQSFLLKKEVGNRQVYLANHDKIERK